MSATDLRALARAARERPYDFGFAVRAIRLFDEAGHRAEAHTVAHAYAARHSAPTRGGDALLAAVLAAPRVSFRPGEMLVREGDDTDDVFVIMAGDARVRRLGVGQIAQLPEGTLVGEIAPLTAANRTASVYARGPVEALCFSAQALAGLCRELPGVYARLRELGRQRMVDQLMGPGSIFASLDGLTRAALFEQCLPCSLPDGATIIEQGRPGTAVCIIASGLAEVWQTTGKDRRLLAQLGPGAVFGEMSILLDRAASASVIAATTLVFFALDRDRFVDLLARFPDALDRVTDLAEERLGLKGKPGTPAPPAVGV